MKRIALIVFCLWTLAGQASDFETIGLDQLRLMVPTLTGTGIHVAQPEAGAPTWQVNPAAVSQPTSLFTWISDSGSATNYPNSLGSESWHANEVGKRFYSVGTGVVPGVAHVDSYDANHFYNTLIASEVAIPARVVNQSFIFAAELPVLDRDYDGYVSRYGTVFASGAGNGGAVSSPATAYNVIAVGAHGGLSSAGPTLDGRCKPDITAPGSMTSFSTPLVAGAAAVLAQAAEREDGGPGTASDARDPKTIKALLLNSATKPADWTNSPVQPLDYRYGAGVLHISSAYRQLRGGRHAPNATESLSVGAPHPPANTSANLPTRRGWARQSISSTLTRAGLHHYFIDLTGVAGRNVTATLVWNRQEGQAGINNLDLFFYDVGSGALIASSESVVDNVEHMHVEGLPGSRYNLQVLKHGGASGRVTASEMYALAFEFGAADPPRLEQQQISAGQFQVRIMGEPNQLYALEASSTLLGWTALVTNKTSAAGWFQFSDLAGGPQRFYRAAERW
ncbi:MAG: S8 family peptidase [Verrucomicrobia subdivision 3 bacterium]|nr:S8 family peptidase [Limisphaerales bacterium]